MYLDQLIKKSSILVVFYCFLASHVAFATTLKGIQMKDEGVAELSFDAKIDPNQLQIDFFNDTVQISLNNVAVFPAKMIPVANSYITKVFAYQYSPKLVRCRFSIKGKAEDFKGKVQTKVNGKVLRITFENHPVIAEAAQDSDLEEKQLMEKVMKINTPPPQPVAVPVEKTEPKKAEPKKVESSEKPVLTGNKSNLTGGKPLPSVWSAFAKLGALLLGLGLLALIVRRYKANPSKEEGDSNWITRLKQIAKGSLTKDGRMMQIVSTQYIGPKKSLVVVRFSGRLLVLGVGSDSINLITQISEKTDEDILDDQATSINTQSALFSEILSSENLKPSSAPNHSLSLNDLQNSTSTTGARSRIRNRLEGLKPL